MTVLMVGVPNACAEGTPPTVIVTTVFGVGTPNTCAELTAPIGFACAVRIVPNACGEAIPVTACVWGGPPSLVVGVPNWTGGTVAPVVACPVVACPLIVTIEPEGQTLGTPIR